MRRLSDRATTALRPVAILILFAGSLACGEKSPAAPSSSGSDAAVPPGHGPRQRGGLITMIGISLTCSHCADFHSQTLPLIGRRSIRWVKLIYRDFPLDNGATLSAAMVCTMLRRPLHTVRPAVTSQPHGPAVPNVTVRSRASSRRRG
jgi:hypothetical protein